MFILNLTVLLQDVVVVGWVMAMSRMCDGKNQCQDVVILGWVMARRSARMLW